MAIKCRKMGGNNAIIIKNKDGELMVRIYNNEIIFDDYVVKVSVEKDQFTGIDTIEVREI